MFVHLFALVICSISLGLWISLIVTENYFYKLHPTYTYIMISMMVGFIFINSYLVYIA